MSEIKPNQKPRLMPGCRLSDAAGQESMLVFAEGALRLNGPALKIVQYCDGTRSFAEIMKLLQAEFATADAARIEKDSITLLERLHAKRVVSYEEG